MKHRNKTSALRAVELFMLKGSTGNRAKLGFARGWCHHQPATNAPKPSDFYQRNNLTGAQKRAKHKKR